MPSFSRVPAVWVIAAGLALALALGSMLPSAMRADEMAPGPAPCLCPGRSQEPRLNLWPRPKYAELGPNQEGADEIAALEALHLALTEIGDGASYIWHRRNGQISGVVQPTTSFRDASGKICRHVIFLLSLGANTKRTEGIACRLDSGVWQLEG